MWFPILTAVAAPESVRPVVVRDDHVLLALGADPSAPPTTPSPDGVRWLEPVGDEVGDGVHLGDAWVALGSDGARTTCRVTGFVRTADDAQGYGAPDDPTCGGWAAWAELACDGPVRDGVGVEGRRTPARTYAERPPTPEERARGAKALAGSDEWRKVLGAMDAVGEPVHVAIDVRPFGPWSVVEASAYTGDGWIGCGSDQLLTRRVLVLDDAGRELLPARALAEPWGRDDRIVDGVYDLDHDGRPELRVVRPLEEVVVVGPDGVERAPLPTRFCGCPC